MKNLIEEIIKEIDVKYTDGKKPISVLDAMTSTIVFYENYVVKVIRGKNYGDDVKKIQTYSNPQYIYNFPYEITEVSGYTIVPMDKLTMVDPDLKNVIVRIPLYLQHKDLYDKFKAIGKEGEFIGTDSYTTSKNKYKNTLTPNAKPIFDNILAIFTEYKTIFGEVQGSRNASNYCVVNDRIKLFDI
jgi:hypothetical protein